MLIEQSQSMQSLGISQSALSATSPVTEGPPGNPHKWREGGLVFFSDTDEPNKNGISGHSFKFDFQNCDRAQVIDVGALSKTRNFAIDGKIVEAAFNLK